MAVDGAAMTKIASQTGYYGYTYTLPSDEGVFWYYVHTTIGGVTTCFAGVFSVWGTRVYNNQAVLKEDITVGPSDGLYLPVAVNKIDGTEDTPSVLTAKVYDNAGSEVLDLTSIIANTGDNTGEYYALLSQANCVTLGAGRFQILFAITDSDSDTPRVLLDFTCEDFNTDVPTISNIAASPVSPDVADEITITFDIDATYSTYYLWVDIDGYKVAATVASDVGTAVFPLGRIRVGTYDIKVLGQLIDSNGEEWSLYDTSTQITVADETITDAPTTLENLLNAEWDTGHIAKPTIDRITEEKMWDFQRGDLLLIYEIAKTSEYVDFQKNFRTEEDHLVMDIRSNSYSDFIKLYKEARRCVATRLTNPGGGYRDIQLGQELDRSNRKTKMYWMTIDVYLYRRAVFVRTATYS